MGEEKKGLYKDIKAIEDSLNRILKDNEFRKRLIRILHDTNLFKTFNSESLKKMLKDNPFDSTTEKNLSKDDYLPVNFL